MIHHLTDKAAVVEVPEDCGGITLYGSQLADEIKYNIMPYIGKFKSISISIPPGDWSILCNDTRSISEEQAREVVGAECFEDDEKYYYIYEKDDRVRQNLFYDTALESFQSLMKSKNLDISKRFVLIVKK